MTTNKKPVWRIVSLVINLILYTLAGIAMITAMNKGEWNQAIFFLIALIWISQDFRRDRPTEVITVNYQRERAS